MTTTRMCLQVSRPAQEQKQSPLGSPETAGQKRQQTGPGQVGNAPGTITHNTERVGSSTASSPMTAASEPSLSLSSSSSSASVGVPAAKSVTLPAATDGLASQAQACEGVQNALRQQKAVLAADDTSGAPATAVVGSEREDYTDQAAAKKAGMGQGQSPGLLASPESSQVAMPSGALPSKRKMVAESDTSVEKKMSRALESEAEVCSTGTGLAASLCEQPAEAEAKVSPASLLATKTCGVLSMFPMH